MAVVTSAEELLERYAKGERDFFQARLTGVNLMGADLSLADLSLADLRHAKLRGGHLRRAGLRGADLSHSTLSGANLNGADLKRANLSFAELQGANLTDADLSYANLNGVRADGTDLYDANLQGANLGDANLSRTDLSRANLQGANLSETELDRANLRGANLERANFDMAMLRKTLLLDVDIAQLLTAARIVHIEPSTVDWRSIVRSCHDPRLGAFLRASGTPPVFADYVIDCAKALSAQEMCTLLRSTFISFGSPDTAFAEKLREALINNGVTAFCFTKDAVPGERLYRVMHEGVNKHDRIVFVCSKESLDRTGVVNELRQALAREAREGGTELLIPIRLDSHVFDGWDPGELGLKQAVCDRVVADFSGWEDQAKFDDGVASLMRALRKPVEVK